MTGIPSYERIFIEIEIEKRSSVRYRAERQPSRQVLLANLINRASRHGPKSVEFKALSVPRRGGLPATYLIYSKFIHKLSILRDFCGGKRAGGDERVGGCPVPALGPFCLIEGYPR